MSSSSSNSSHQSSEEMEEDPHVDSLGEVDSEEEEYQEEEETCPPSLEESEEDEEEEESEESRSKRRKTKKKPGIIYLSSIPPGFNVSRTTAYFSKLGQVGRVFLQPNLRDKSKYKSFTEGWIEFMSKSDARQVAESLNCSHVGGKKRSKSAELLWNVKYLPRFKWSHLTERSNYERAVHSQRMRSEVSQAKKEGDYFKANLERSKRMKKNPPSEEQQPYEFFLKETSDSRRKRQCTNPSPAGASSSSKRAKREAAPAPPKKGKKGPGKGKRAEFLKNVFSGPSE